MKIELYESESDDDSLLQEEIYYSESLSEQKPPHPQNLQSIDGGLPDPPVTPQITPVVMSKGGGMAEHSSAEAIGEDSVASIMNENRDFIRVEVAGAQITIVGPKLATAFRDRLQENQTCIKMPLTPIKSKTMGYLDVTVEIDGHSKNMRWRVADYLDDEIMLGADFKNLWHIDSRSKESK